MNMCEENVSRRRILELLAGFGIAGAVAEELLAQARHPVSIDALRQAATLLDKDYDEERLKVIATALQRNLDQFQLLRDLDIEDSVEPALLFRAEGR